MKIKVITLAFSSLIILLLGSLYIANKEIITAKYNSTVYFLDNIDSSSTIRAIIRIDEVDFDVNLINVKYNLLEGFIKESKIKEIINDRYSTYIILEIEGQDITKIKKFYYYFDDDEKSINRARIKTDVKVNLSGGDLVLYPNNRIFYLSDDFDTVNTLVLDSDTTSLNLDFDSNCDLQEKSEESWYSLLEIKSRDKCKLVIESGFKMAFNDFSYIDNSKLKRADNLIYEINILQNADNEVVVNAKDEVKIYGSITNTSDFPLPFELYLTTIPKLALTFDEFGFVTISSGILKPKETKNVEIYKTAEHNFFKLYAEREDIVEIEIKLAGSSWFDDSYQDILSLKRKFVFDDKLVK